MEWDKMKRKLHASLTIMTENYIARPSSMGKSASAKNATNSEEVSDLRTTSPWKFDTDIWFEMPPLYSLAAPHSQQLATTTASYDKKPTKLNHSKLLKVESLSEKKQDKKKLDEM